jgi:uncharacterized protein
MDTVGKALVVVNGDDVYEDVFAASLELQDILTAAGFATAVGAGTARFDDAAALADTDLVVLYTATGEFPPQRQRALAARVRGGAGLLAIHASNVLGTPGAHVDPAYAEAFALIGSRYVSHGPLPHESRFRVETDGRHPVTRGIGAFEITHEHYHVETADDVEVVAWRCEGTRREPLVHTRNWGEGRVCYVQLGHDLRAWGEPQLRATITQAALWAGRKREHEVRAGQPRDAARAASRPQGVAR